MIRKRLLIPAVATALMALAAAAPAAAQTPSCVGWYASTFAQEDPRGFATEISGLARTEQPFGASVVAPFAHLPLEICQAGE